MWGDPDLVFLIGGGNEGVRAIAQDAELAGYPNVFAVADRDRGPSNFAQWLDPRKTSRIFVLPVHEVENSLLDAEALVASPYNAHRRTRDQLDAQMQAHAQSLCWWMAGCEVVSELRRRFRVNFVTDPKSAGVDDEPTIMRYIVEHPWFQKLADEADRTTENDIRRLLRAEHASAAQKVVTGQWRREFAGKEMFHHIVSMIASVPQNATIRSDLAKEVAVWQRSNGSTPQDLRDFLNALKQRIARPS